VISPEGCASILGKGADKAPEAAEAMGITSQRLNELGLVDEIVEEPLGGAHRDVDLTAQRVKQALNERLLHLDSIAIDELLESRYQKLMSYGEYKS